MLRRLGAVQLDTISVLARSHELVAYARLGPIGREAVHRAYWGYPARAFEYWAHAMCVLPLEEWPHFAARRRRRAEWRGTPSAAQRRGMDRVRAILRERGPITTADLGGAREGSAGWWSWSPLKIAIERLLSDGEVACVDRRGWRRVYDLADRAIPAALRRRTPSDAECHVRLVTLAAERLGVATARELATYFGGVRMAEMAPVIEAAGLVPVRVRGWTEAAWAHPAALAALGERIRHRTALLSPFDSLVWDRSRARRIFGFSVTLEAYVPARRRVHGYFAMPLLHGGRLLGRVDPKREGRTLLARRVSLDAASAIEPMARALAEAASWVGCDAVSLERVAPPAARSPLRAALREIL